MKRQSATLPARRRWRWLAGMAALMLLVPLIFLWFFNKIEPRQPIAFFMPDRLAGAARLSDLENAWRRHWAGRPGTTPEAALKDWYIAQGKWEKMVKKHGEMQSWLRIKAIPAALFSAIGEESWLLAGEWGGNQAGQGEAGLVLLLPGSGSIQRSAGTIAEMFLDEYDVKTTETQGVKLYEYQSKTERKSLTFCRAGGWIVASMRRHGLGPLPAILARLKSGMAELPGMQPKENPLLQGAATSNQALWMTFQPAALWQYIEQMNRQRGRKMSAASQAKLALWRGKLQGFERVTLAQSGDSLLDLNMIAAREKAFPLEATSATMTANRGMRSAMAGGRFIALAEGSTRVARALPDWLALSTETQKAMNPQGLDLFLSGFPKFVENEMKREGEARMGVAIYPSPLVIPRVLAWGKKEAWFGLAVAGSGPPEKGWPGLVQQTWSRGGTPSGFLAIDFGALSRALESVPAPMLGNKKKRKKFEKQQALARSLAFALGGACLRLDLSENETTLQLRTIGKMKNQ